MLTANDPLRGCPLLTGQASPAALGLRAGDKDLFIVSQTTIAREF
jgi:hypothetical protein